MAHKKKIRRYRKGGPARLDMRKGGRVGFVLGGGSGEGTGGVPSEEELFDAAEAFKKAYGGDPKWHSKYNEWQSQFGPQYAHDPHAAQSIDPTRRTWTPVTQQTQWNLDPSLQTYGYDQAVSYGMKPPTQHTPSDPSTPTGPLGGQIGPKIKEWWQKDKKGNNLIFNSVKNIWEVAKDVVNPFDGSYPIAKLVKQTGETLVPGGENPLADWFNKQNTTNNVGVPAEGSAAGAQAQGAALGNVSPPVVNQPIPTLTLQQQQAQDMAIQEQIASDQAAVQQDGGLPSQAGTTTVGTITDTPVTQAGEYEEEPGDDAGTDDRGETISFEEWEEQFGSQIDPEYYNTLTDEQKQEMYQAYLRGLNLGDQTGSGTPEGGWTDYTPAVRDIEETTVGPPKEVPVGEELTTTELAAPTRTEAATIQDKDITPEQVSTVQDISQAQAPREVTGQEYTAEELKRVPVFDPATGAVTEDMKASLDEKALTFQASGVDFTQEQKDRPLLDRVTGVLSPEAKATAAKVAGTDLPRLLRAKKQLRRAGLSEEEINLIGSDPDTLEAELGDYTEEQRGMIAGLPDEALVSTQMNTLLEGMESGEIPAFARPAVAAVNQMLAERGLSASTVGRDNLFNAVIQAAMPLAQSNAQSIKESIFQQRGIEAQAELQNAEMRQRTALSNSEKVFNMDMAQFSADQQRVMSQSKFLQTTSLQEVSNDQAAVVQTAINTAQLDIANLNTQERLQVQNAQAFLNMEMTNLDRTQQQRALNSQQEQQQMLSNQASINAARNFAATSQQQADQFTAGLAANIDQFNTQQFNAMQQFNATQENAAEARRAGREADVAKFNAELITRNDQFNAQQDFETNKWLANNTALVKQSNMDWRRKINLADTAALNAVNMQNAMNAYNAGEKEMDRLWQTARDEADFAFRSAENKKQRATTIIATAIANEGDEDAYSDSVLSFIKSTITNWG